MDGFGPVTVTAAEVTPSGKPNSYNCHLDAEVIVEAKMVATSRNVTLAEYVTELVRDLGTGTSSRRWRAGFPPRPSESEVTHERQTKTP